MAADPVAEKSTFLRMYMSNHPDTLVAYAKWHGKVDAPITSAEMTDISTKSMTLLCTLKSGEKQSTTITFSPPLAGYDDVKPRLLEMKAIAQENLGMTVIPQITTFKFPQRHGYGAVAIMTTLSFLTFFPENFLANPVINVLGESIVQGAFKTAIAIHALESLYTLSICRKHTGFVVGTLYTAGTVLLGFCMWVDLRKRIQKARIDSVMKIE